MIKISKIHLKEHYIIECIFNDGVIKNMYCLPIFEKHKNIEGINNLYKHDVFSKVEIVELGELVWINVIKTDLSNCSL
ncbi:MAG: hypothetical protein QM539_07470 [Alphaproteobacteria bacterium]|nr:hypothetical protein [Alphaproteobacteria bacterium]